MLHRTISFCALVVTWISCADASALDKWCFASFTITHSDAPEVILAQYQGFDETQWVYLPSASQGNYRLEWSQDLGCTSFSEVNVFKNCDQELVQSSYSGSLDLNDNSYYLAYIEGIWLDNYPRMNILIGEVPYKELSVFVNLGGAWDPVSEMMRDDLRTGGHLPLVAGSSWLTESESMRTTTPDVLAINGSDAVVDWVRVDIRKVGTNKLMYAAPGLLKRSGEVTAADGISPLSIPASTGEYMIVIRHRNHLAISTAAGIQLTSGTNTLDLRNNDVPIHGTEPMKQLGAQRGLWPGNAGAIPNYHSATGSVSYTGSNNDRDKVLQRIGGLIPTNTVAGYYNEDVNLDGVVKYSGSGNDRDIILQTIGGIIPTNVRSDQLSTGW